MKITVLGEIHDIPNKIALSIFEQMNSYFSSHCAECGKEFRQEDQVINYQNIGINKVGFICQECAEELVEWLEIPFEKKEE